MDWIPARAICAWEKASSAAHSLAECWPLEWTPEVWHVAALVGALGLLWAFHPSVDSRLGLGLWPWAIIGAIVVLPPTLLVLAAIAIVAALQAPSPGRSNTAKGSEVPRRS